MAGQEYLPHKSAGEGGRVRLHRMLQQPNCRHSILGYLKPIAFEPEAGIAFRGEGFLNRVLDGKAADGVVLREPGWTEGGA